MNYTFHSIKYILKNFRYIFPFSILPAIFLAISLDANAVETLVYAYVNGIPETLSFGEIFRAISVFNFHSVGAFFTGALGIAAMVICTSLMLAFIEKHMRIGKRTFNGIFSRLNDNLLSTCAVCVLLSALYELWSLIVAALLFFICRIGALGLVYALSVFVFLGLQFVLCLLISVFYLWLPCMQITGFRAFEAFGYSYQLVAPAMGKIATGQFFSLTAAELVIAGIAYFASSTPAIMISATVLYSVMTLVFCVRMEVAYFDRAQMDRVDLRKYYYVDKE